MGLGLPHGGTRLIAKPTRSADRSLPGKPGSITEGKQEQRGYEIRVDVPASTAIAIKATLTVEAKR